MQNSHNQMKESTGKQPDRRQLHIFGVVWCQTKQRFAK